MPTYVMSCFKLPLSFLRSIESSAADFCWHCRGKRLIHWVVWSKFCRAKEGGGLGFHSLPEFNPALLATQGWQILYRPYSLLSRVLQAKYFQGRDFWNATLGLRPSLTWRSIVGARELLEEGWRWEQDEGGRGR
ncbi:UNVERIFIED_CONTAM: hypothetical protein Slati_0997100 [Sesamum latifolium]|uniref:Mitochondrial protein n=1 Tax=Sesamum latifolium TaxID=2727402 RepID=A0AAW2XRM0_9LAMI